MDAWFSLGKGSQNQLGKFTPNGKSGIFLGYHIQPGHIWRGDDNPFRTPEDDFAQAIRRAIVEGFKNLKGQDEGKPKAKEAEKVELPEFPSPSIRLGEQQ